MSAILTAGMHCNLIASLKKEIKEWKTDIDELIIQRNECRSSDSTFTRYYATFLTTDINVKQRALRAVVESLKGS